MRKLERGAAPGCLRDYQNSQTWGDMIPAHKGELWAELETMQSVRCAYCERSIRKADKRHMEHFRKRERFPNLCFSWENLFGSCESSEHCGHYKDSRNVGRYEVDELLKPDVDDPEEFLIFLADGSVRAKSGLSEQDQRRAEETIRVLGLDIPSLRARRRAVVQTHSYLLHELIQIQEEFAQADFMMLATDLRDQLALADCAASAREQYRALF